jgi:hypothetical protein
MQWQLDFPKTQLQNSVSLDRHFLSLGSCFAEGVGNWMKDRFLSIDINPLGICFNPISLSKQLDIFSQKISISNSIENNGLYLNLDAHSQFSHPHWQEHQSRLEAAISKGISAYQSSSILILTLGTAYAYEYKERKEMVANCHKIPSNRFKKGLLSIEEIESALSLSIREFLESKKDGKVILTVSPVRHTKEGLVENNRSKARLIEACHLLTEKIVECFYFPSYEGLIDVLRDHRFYAEDLVHPTKMAADFIAEKFAEFLFNDQSNKDLKKLEEMKKRLNHRSLFPESAADQMRRDQLQQELQELQKRFPFLKLTI